MDKYKFAEISTRPFPSILDVENPWIFGKTGVVINVSEHEDQRVINIYKKKKINYYHFPLNEESENMGWENILKAVSVLLNCVHNQIPAIVHCIGGNNRSPLIVECLYFVLYQEHLPDEYKGCFNHLFYNLSNGHIPFILKEVEHLLSQLSNAITQDSFTELM